MHGRQTRTAGRSLVDGAANQRMAKAEDGAARSVGRIRSAASSSSRAERTRSPAPRWRLPPAPARTDHRQRRPFQHLAHVRRQQAHLAGQGRPARRGHARHPRRYPPARIGSLCPSSASRKNGCPALEVRRRARRGAATPSARSPPCVTVVPRREYRPNRSRTARLERRLEVWRSTRTGGERRAGRAFGGGRWRSRAITSAEAASAHCTSSSRTVTG